MLGVTGSGPRFRKPAKLSEGKIVMFRLMRRSKFSRCWVIVSLGCSEKNTVPPVTREVTEYPYVNWCLPCLSCVRFVPCCHCLCIRSFVPCHWNAGLLRLVGLKEYGLGTQSLGRWIFHCPRLELHRLIIRTWHTAWRPETTTTTTTTSQGPRQRRGRNTKGYKAEGIQRNHVSGTPGVPNWKSFSETSYWCILSPSMSPIWLLWM